MKRVAHCRVPDHGTWCEVARERPNRYPRSTERRLALLYERLADTGRC